MAAQHTPKPTPWSAGLVLIYVNVALYALAFQAQTPAQPYLVKSLSAGSGVVETWAQFKSWTGLLQVVGSLLSGYLIDNFFGSKAVLILSFVASALSYALTAAATDMRMLYAAQLPTVFQHAILAARAWVAIHTDGRAELLSYIGVAYGVGFVIGPALGGQLASLTSPQATAAVAAVISAISAILVAVYVSGAPVKKAQELKGELAVPTSLWGSLSAAVGSKQQASLLALKLIFSFAVAIFHSVFSLVAAERFGLDAAGVGALMSFVGGVGLFAQALMVGWITQRFSDWTVTAGSSVLLAVLFAAFATISTKVELFLLCVPLTLVSTVYGMVNTAAIMKLAPHESKGSLVALDMAIGSAARMICPAISGYLLTTHGYWSVGASSSALMCLMSVLVVSNMAVCDATATRKLN